MDNWHSSAFDYTVSDQQLAGEKGRTRNLRGCFICSSVSGDVQRLPLLVPQPVLMQTLYQQEHRNCRSSEQSERLFPKMLG